MMSKKNNITKIIVIIMSLFFINISYADNTEKIYITDLTGLWTDNNNNYFSLQVEDGMVLFIDLSGSLPRAEELERIGVEPRVEYLSHYGKAHTKSLDEEDLFIPPIVNLLEVFPQITRQIMDIDIRIQPLSPSEIYFSNLCDQCSGDNSFSRTLYKIF